MKKNEILNSIQDLYPVGLKLFGNLDTSAWTNEVFPGKWCIGEQMGHLLLSGYPISGLLKQPGEFFTKFGSPTKPSRSFENLYSEYKAYNNGVLIAPAQFTPKKSEILMGNEAFAAWKALLDKTCHRIESVWTEERLDQHLLPHPAMGSMTMRELLYFKIFHTKHHYESIQELINHLKLRTIN